MLPDHIEAVLFDAGGTLVTLDYAFIAERVRRSGFAVDPARLPRAEAEARLAVDRARLEGDDASRRSSYFGTLLEAAGVDSEAVPELVAALEREHAERNLWRIVAPDVAATLRGLRQRELRTGVVSNSDGRVEALLAAQGLTQYLELVVDSHLEGVEKPAPAIFQRALLRMRLEAGRCAYVGDIYSVDVLGARAAGLEPVIIDPTGAYGRLDCRVIGRLAELLGVPGPGARGAP